MIRTHGLTFSYAGGSTLAFSDIEVPQGGVLLLRGPSGSGKSTWLALAAGLVKAKSGALEVAGRVLASEVPGMARPSRSALDRWRAASIGFLPQKLHLSPALSVRDNLAMAQWAAGRAEDNRQILQALSALGVDDLAQRKPAQLSGGQAQRVALARAVLLQPKLILADEPTASLDDTAAAVAALLLQKSAHASGATLVIASHDARILQFFAAAQNAMVLALESKPTGSVA
jgi:putative ABC transport system ATP-binding protein